MNHGLSFDWLYARESIDSALAAYLPPELHTPVLRRIAANGFLTAQGLRRICKVLGATICKFGQIRVVELGCGAGGLSKYISSKFSCNVVGIDTAPLAIARARSAATSSRPRSGLLKFRVADFACTGIVRRTASAIVSLDSLYLADDPITALKEARSLLVHGGTLWFSTYVATDFFPGGGRLHADWRPFLAQAHLHVLDHRDVSKEWQEIMRVKHLSRWKHRREIRAALGASADAELEVSAAMLGIRIKPAFLDVVSRFEILATQIPETT